MFKKLSTIWITLFILPSICTAAYDSKVRNEFPPMNQIYHPVSTQNVEAQKAFDLGLTNIYAFNHDLAFDQFEKASKLDPDLAMAYWGMALALGQNINDDITPEREAKSYKYIQKALSLLDKASPVERDYIESLATRYTNNPRANLIPFRSYYREAMKKLSAKYPEDLDAITLYAESILDIDPWKWWKEDGQPTHDILEAITALDFVLKRNPQHIGANHYAIHAWEESPTPERALMQAHRLQHLIKTSGHLLHMPSHIFLLVGDYELAKQSNLDAIAQDKEYIRKVGLEKGPYPLHYMTHNLYILTRVYMLMEDYENAIKSALELSKMVEQHGTSSNKTSKIISPLEIYLFFHKWNEILNYKINSGLASLQTYLHYARAMAFLGLGNLEEAKEEKRKMVNMSHEITDSETIGAESARKVAYFSMLLLDAAIAKAQGQKELELEKLKKAITMQDKFSYDEPPTWYYPIRADLGFALLNQKRYEEAEVEFRKALRGLQRNGRLLFGLYHSLKGQGREWDAEWVNRELTQVFKTTKTPLPSDLLQ